VLITFDVYRHSCELLSTSQCDGKYFWYMGTRDPIFLIIKIIFSCFKKIKKINIDIVNDVTYKYAKF
jgi:hypothetical protein